MGVPSDYTNGAGEEMPNVADINLAQYADGVITIAMTPPVAVGGWSVKFTMARRFSSDSGICFRYGASGFGGGESGVTVLDSGLGRFRVKAPSPEETSGLEPGNFAIQFERTDSGSRTVLSQGYEVMTPNVRRSP